MRAQQSRLFRQIGNDGALVPDMIAGSEQIDLGIQEILGDLGCDAESGRRVLDIGNAEVYAIFLDQAVKFFLNQSSARFAEYVADERVLASVPAFRRRYKKSAPAPPCGESI